MFNIVLDVFARMLVKGGQASLVTGLCSYFVPWGSCVYNM